MKVKYVNMADIIVDSPEPANGMQAGPDTPADQPQEIVALIELLFFAYRDFVSDPDQILDDYGFGRAHHRVIHFIGRNPGMHVAELLDILRITKQSLSRVLRELIDKQFVYQREGSRDRRRRLLYLTPQGRELHQRLMAPQIRRIAAALDDIGPEASNALREALLHITDADGRSDVLGLIGNESDE